MPLNIRPTLSALLKNRTGPLLAALQVAITLAVLINAAYIVHQRVVKMSLDTGVDEQNLFQVMTEGFTPRFDATAAIKEDLAYLRSLPGVVDATPGDTFPMGWSNQSWPVYSNASAQGQPLSISMFASDEHALNTYGARLLAGRNFRPDEILPNWVLSNAMDFVPEVIVTESAARALFPHANALGRALYDRSGRPATIIGITNDVVAPGWAYQHGTNYVMFVPRARAFNGTGYAVRTLPGQRDRMMRIVEQHLSTSNPNRVVDYVKSLEYFRDQIFQEDRNNAIFLVAVTVLVVTIACIGIFALATFNVSTRTKQIGTRRALGARRGDIVRYFLVENALVTTAGILIGCALALAAGYWLSLQYQLPRLDLYYLVGGVLVLWLVGLLAAWQPAWRAASVPPSVATRTV